MRNISYRWALGLLLAFAACAADDESEAVCGDGLCFGESATSCPADCGSSPGPRCGDGQCTSGETSSSCASDCPAGPRCGDGSCDLTESSSTCPSDCGTAACTAIPDSCTGNNICVNQQCVGAFPRTYNVVNVQVSVPATDPSDGLEWDIGSPPDMYVGDAARNAQTATVQDQYTATFNGPIPVFLTAGQEFYVYVWDADLSTADYVTGCGSAAVAAATLRGRVLSCSTNGISFSAAILPQ